MNESIEYWFAYTGPKHKEDLFETHMQSQPVTIEGIAPNGTRFQQSYNAIFEPIKLARFIGPAALLPTTHATLNLGGKHGLIFDTGVAALGKVLGLDPIPKDLPPVQSRLNVSTENIHIIPIGIKRESARVMHATGVKQPPI